MSHYRPKRSFGQGNIFTLVCHSVHGGGLARRTPPAWSPPGPDTPPWDQTPPDQTPPPPRHGEPPPRPDTTTPPGMENPPAWRTPPILRHTVYNRPVRILLECILVAITLPIFNEDLFLLKTRKTPYVLPIRLCYRYAIKNAANRYDMNLTLKEY